MPTLVFSDVDGIDRAFELGTEPIFIGRGLECAVRSEDPRVSRIHARLFIEPSGVWIEDMGSSNGVFVGPQKITRALVPIAEVVIIGSIMMRMLAHDGTLPPPLGVHGTLAQWLIIERRSRSTIEQERDAFAKRVGELTHDVQVLVDAHHAPKTGAASDDIIRLRDDAEARAIGLERALSAAQQELLAVTQGRPSGDGVDKALFESERKLKAATDRIEALEKQIGDVEITQRRPDQGKLTQQVEKLKSQAEQANLARKQVEQTAAAGRAEANKLRHELEQLRKNASREQEALKLELAQAKISGANNGSTEQLQGELAKLREQIASATPEDFQRRIQALLQQAENAEKKAASAELRAQGAQRHVAEANIKATATLKQISEWKSNATAANDKVDGLNTQIAALGKQIVELEQKLTASTKDTDVEMVNIVAAGARLQADASALQVAAEESVQRLEKALAEQTHLCTAATTEAAAAKATLAMMQQRMATAEQQCEQVNRKLLTAEQMLLNQSDASEQILAARKDRDEALLAMKQEQEKTQKAAQAVEEADLRASAADTIAKSMAKDVSNSLRRAVESDAKNKHLAKELAAAHQRESSHEATRKNDLEQLEAAKTALARLEQQLPFLQATLAAEQASVLAITNRRDALQKESVEQQSLIAQLRRQSEEATHALEEYESHVEALAERITDLESQISVEATAHDVAMKQLKKNASAAITAARASAQTAVDEARQKAQTEIQAAAELAAANLATEQAKISSLHSELAEAKDIARETARAGEPMRAKMAELEAELAKSRQLLAQSIADPSASQPASFNIDELERLTQRAAEAEETAERLQAKVDSAEMALGRAFALERQLDEALSRLARFERGKPLDYSTSINDEERLANAQSELLTAQQQVRDLQDEIAIKAKQVSVSLDELASANKQARLAKEELDAITERLIESNRQLENASQRSQEMQRSLQTSEAANDALQQRSNDQLADLTSQLQQAKKQLGGLTDSRSDEDRLRRQMENLQSELKRVQALLATRDAVLAELQSSDAHRNKTSNGFDEGERTANAPEISRYEATAAELAALRKELGMVREQLAATENGVDGENEITAVRGALPHGFLEGLSVLEESIDSLRANLRSASDETSSMPKTSAVGVVASALAQATEDIARARGALRDMAALANSSPLN